MHQLCKTSIGDPKHMLNFRVARSLNIYQIIRNSLVIFRTFDPLVTLEKSTLQFAHGRQEVRTNLFLNQHKIKVGKDFLSFFKATPVSTCKNEIL